MKNLQIQRVKTKKEAVGMICVCGVFHMDLIPWHWSKSMSLHLNGSGKGHRAHYFKITAKNH